jgi:predicted RNase H-like HicB family nuclease
MMERIIKIHIKQLPEGMYLATSDEIQGLVAQGRTINETLEIARDVAKKLLEAQGKLPESLTVIKKSLDIPLVLGI